MNIHSKNHKSQISILVLSDGKPGHYNQSLGIIDSMKDVYAEVKQIRFKKKWRDNTLRVITRLIYRIDISNKLIKALLKWSLESSSFSQLQELGHFDAVLSTGSSVAAPNFWLSKIIGAKSVVCTRPSPIGIKPYDLAILPEHTRLQGKNVIRTFGVPNRINPEFVKAKGEELLCKINTGGKKVIGVLLGGEDPYYSIPPDLMAVISDVLIDISKSIGVCLAVTTSRRTDPKSEEIVHSKLSNDLCCLLVLANQQKESPVPGIIGMSEVVIVTEDSFSMVCEAASSGKKVIILEVKRKRSGNPKRQRVYKLMAEKGYVRISDIYRLKQSLINFMNATGQPEVLNDAKVAANAILGLLCLQENLHN